MHKPYDWLCKVCTAANIHSTDDCEECGAPQILRPLEVGHLKSKRGGPPLSREDQKELARLKKVEALSDGERALYWAFFVPLLVVGFLFKSATFWLINTYGFVVIIAGATIGGLFWIVAGSERESSAADPLERNRAQD
jgi:hypothetical protein